MIAHLRALLRETLACVSFLSASAGVLKRSEHPKLRFRCASFLAVSPVMMLRLSDCLSSRFCPQESRLLAVWPAGKRADSTFLPVLSGLFLDGVDEVLLAVDVHLLVNAFQVVAHRVVGNEKLRGDVGTVATLGIQADDFLLASGQAIFLAERRNSLFERSFLGV